MRAFIAAIFVAAFFAQTCHAQPSQLQGMSPKEKIRSEYKEKIKRENDESYKSSLDRIPDSDKKVDPWGTLRAPNTPSGAK